MGNLLEYIDKFEPIDIIMFFRNEEIQAKDYF